LTRDSSGNQHNQLIQKQVNEINKNRFSRIAGEAVVIFVSVFVAIWLESEWQNRADRIEARESLGQLLAELRADKEFAKQVRVEQTTFLETTEKILIWLENKDSHPKQSDQDVFENLNSVITMWPRRAAWTTMVASGQLGLINDKGLVARLGDFYEHQQIRLVYNGESYDAAHEEVGVHFIPEVWDFQRHELITSDYEKIAALHGRVRWINTWAAWYLDSLADYEKALNKLIEDVDDYLQVHSV
jgi:hypothetical protein